MNVRFSQYLRTKGITQHKLSELSCVPASTISRFLSGRPVGSDSLVKLLQVCDDLSLEWLFFGSGQMFRSRDGVTVNMGAFAGADVASGGDLTMIRESPGAAVRGSGEAYGGSFASLKEKDRVIAERDRAISERDALVSRLYALLLEKGVPGIPNP